MWNFIHSQLSITVYYRFLLFIVGCRNVEINRKVLLDPIIRYRNCVDTTVNRNTYVVKCAVVV